ICAASPIPATLSTASSRPNSSTAARIVASTSASLVTSQWNGSTPGPSSVAVSASAPLMSAATTFAPSPAKIATDALAIPDPAPVITATLPSNRPMAPPRLWCHDRGTKCRTAATGRGEGSGDGMTVRVVQWTTGNVGRCAVRAIVAHPDLELVGCYAFSADKVGRDAGALAGIDPVGVAATDDIDALLALRPDCVVYTPMWSSTDEVV